MTLIEAGVNISGERDLFDRQTLAVMSVLANNYESLLHWRTIARKAQLNDSNSNTNRLIKTYINRCRIILRSSQFSNYLSIYNLKRHGLYMLAEQANYEVGSDVNHTDFTLFAPSEIEDKVAQACALTVVDSTTLKSPLQPNEYRLFRSLVDHYPHVVKKQELAFSIKPFVPYLLECDTLQVAKHKSKLMHYLHSYNLHIARYKNEGYRLELLK